MKAPRWFQDGPRWLKAASQIPNAQDGYACDAKPSGSIRFLPSVLPQFVFSPVRFNSAQAAVPLIPVRFGFGVYSVQAVPVPIGSVHAVPVRF